MPRKMTRQYADDIIARLSALPPDATPKWGKSTLPQVLGHLADTVRYTMGRGPDLPFKGTWKTRVVYRFLIVNQIVAIPHNIRIPRPDGKKGTIAFRDGDVDDLKGVLDEYLARIDAKDLPSRMHPFFGVLSANDWRRFHVAHFTHHLKQFGV